MYKLDWNLYLSNKRMRESKRINDSRNDFESDFGRVAFSSPLRRMHDKTQVIPLTNGDSVHTRLTHSIEVMNIAHSLGIYLCRDDEFIKCYGEIYSFNLEQKICPILRTAAIIHDIGNPPFGHFGEIIIQSYFKDKKAELNEFAPDFLYFDGNSQGFRNITRLAYADDMYGLNLTFATLGAFLKYPNIDTPPSKKEREEAQKSGNPEITYIGRKKHGIYVSEKDVFERIVEECHLQTDKYIKRHPLSFLVEAADSICYLCMDLEDALQLKWVSLPGFIEYAKTWVEKDTGTPDFNILQFLGIDKAIFDTYSEVKQRITLRVALINYLVNIAKCNFITNLEDIDQGKYSKELIFDDKNNIANILKDYAAHNILCHRDVEQAEITGEAVLNGLMNRLFDLISNPDKKYYSKLKNIISKSALKIIIHKNNHSDKESYAITRDDLSKVDLSSLDYYDKARIIVDFISGMTDSYAVKLYQKLSGMRL